MKKEFDASPFIGLFFFAVLIFFGYKVVTSENENEIRGELYQCFKGGERIYASNTRPADRGGGWWYAGTVTFHADDCFCMGCIGF